MKYVTLYGGFHNVGRIRARVTEEQYKELCEGFLPLNETFTDYQMKRLNRHFCGVKGCTCGGVMRATIDLI